MHFTKRRFRKPLYKKLLSLRKNIYNNTKFLKFKKQKWQKLKFQIIKNRKRKVFYNPTAYVLFNFKNFFNKKFSYNLQNKQRLSYHYGGLKSLYLKQLVKSNIQKSKNTNTYIATLLLTHLEMRLDAVLCRVYFCSSFNTARQLISHKKVYVNNKIVRHYSYQVQKSDLITFDKSVYNFICQNVHQNAKINKFWPIVPKYVYVNYKTLKILIVENIKYTNHLMNYQFFVDFNSFIQFYKL